MKKEEYGETICKNCKNECRLLKNSCCYCDMENLMPFTNPKYILGLCYDCSKRYKKNLENYEKIMNDEITNFNIETSKTKLYSKNKYP